MKLVALIYFFHWYDGVTKWALNLYYYDVITIRNGEYHNVNTDDDF